jgi:hypothetical protein
MGERSDVQTREDTACLALLSSAKLIPPTATPLHDPHPPHKRDSTPHRHPPPRPPPRPHAGLLPPRQPPRPPLPHPLQRRLRP